MALAMALATAVAMAWPTKLRFPEIAISGKIAIFDVPDFFVKKIRKNPENLFFGLLGPKSNFEFFMIFLYDRYFLYKPSFPGS